MRIGGGGEYLFTWLGSIRQLQVPEGLYSKSISHGRSQFNGHTGERTAEGGLTFAQIANSGVHPPR
jgi:hypothetical protein